MDTNKKEGPEKEIKVPETGMEHLDAVSDEALSQTEKVTEVVGEISGEDIKGGQSKTGGDDKKHGFFDGISNKVSSLLFSKKEAVLPSKEVQIKKVQKLLEKERKILLRKIKRVENGRHFSADTLEQLMRQVRSVQKLISELFYMATNKLEYLYKKYVLKKL